VIVWGNNGQRVFRREEDFKLYLRLPGEYKNNEVRPHFCDFKLYPGSKTEEKETQEARELAAKSKMGNSKGTVYTTKDSFEKVMAFYKDLGKEYKMPSQKEGKVKKLPSGQELKEAYFILDGAEELMGSKLWIKIQQPYIGKVSMGQGFQVKYEDVRDVTAIVVSEK
jgi:hypothetical protein